MKTRNAIAAASLSLLTLAGGAAAMTAPPAAAATTHPAATAASQAAGTVIGCIRFSNPVTNDVRIRVKPSTSSATEGYAYTRDKYTIDGCKTVSGSWYTACGTTSNRWWPVRLHGRWYWSATGCWWTVDYSYYG